MRHNYAILSLLLLVFFLGCSNKRNTFVSRQYHDLTAYYNVLFNGRESYKQGVKKSEKAEPQNFDEILPVFSFEYATVAGLVSSDMQCTIEKAKKTVEKHSITAKPKKKKGMTKKEREFYNKREFNIFVDDAYLLMGQANVFLKEYDEAKKIFEYANLEYPKESSIFSTRLWLAIVQIQQGEFGTAENTLKLLQKDKNFPPKLIPTLNASWADLKIKQKQYSDAIKYLTEALAKTRNKSTKIRYNYILAQLYQKTGDNAKATAQYDKVLKLNPPYYTAFNAQLAKVFSYDAMDQKSKIRKVLEKALKDSRNEEYLDQIYYALAIVEKADNNMPKAIEYYNKSISVSDINNVQKALSYDALGDYYYNLPDYIKAYCYYDSSFKFIGQEHSLYGEIYGKVNQLKKLAENLEIIKHQDSLQAIALLPPEERTKIIDKKIETVTSAEKEQQEQKQIEYDQINLANKSSYNDSKTAQAASGGRWYFYNTTALSLGYTDFKMRWGSRKLEDNWRRRNKGEQLVDQIDDDEVPASDNTTTMVSQAQKQKKGLTPKDPEYYLLDLPVGSEAMQESNKTILNAMFNVGEAYRDDLHNYKSAIMAFEEINQRFPNSELQPDSYIALYNLYVKEGNADKAEYYKNLMAQMYPNNPQVKATLDPNYIKQLQKEQAEAEYAYNLVITEYVNGNYSKASAMADNVIQNEPNNILLPQYYLLKALTTDYKSDTVQYVSSLNKIIEEFPKNNVADEAKRLLANLNRKIDFGSETTITPIDTTVKVNYSTNDSEHYFAIYVTNKASINQLKFNLTTWNADMYLNENYEITDEDMSLSNRLILVGVFADKAKAIEYYRKITSESIVFDDQPSGSYYTCIISDINLFLLRDSKYFKGYYDFFLTNY